MAAPAMVGLLAFFALPFVAAVCISLTNLRLGSPLPTELVGLEQYHRLVGDGTFLRALANNAIFAAVVVPVQTGLALALALLLERAGGLAASVRALVFLPVVFPLSLVAVIWVLLYAPGPQGPVNALLSRLTLGAWEARDILRDPALALPAIMLTSIWQGTGLQMVLLLAGLQAIPTERYEAARVDGAGALARFVHVTLPGLRNTLAFVSIATSILAFRLFDQVQVMTRGGPNDATTTVIYEAVQASFVRLEIARGSAMTVVFFLVVLALTFVQRRLWHQQREEL
jgi:multiple sugar transport system permease protein